MDLKKQINKRLKDIVFIELKNEINLGKLVLERQTNLPIRLDSLIEGIRDQAIEDKIQITRINEGIIYLLGIEKDFRYKDKYLEIIKVSVADIKSLILYLSSKAAQEEDYIGSYIYLNSYDNFLKYDQELEFSKINMQENIYNDKYKEMTEEEQKESLEKIGQEYENILNKDNKFSLAYYRLAYIYRNLNYYLKAKLYFEKFLEFSDDKYQDLRDEVRENLRELEDYANIEAAESYIAYGKLNESYESLNEVSILYPEKEKLNYYKALTEYGLGLFNQSLDHINESLKFNDQIEEYFNLKAQIYLNLDKIKEASLTYKKAISKIKDSYLLNYNYGLLLYKIEDEDYKEYLEKAYEIRPSQELKNIIKKA